MSADTNSISAGGRLQHSGRTSGGAGERWLQAANRMRNINDKRNMYAYKNIDINHEIRVLKLYRGARGSKIICSLAPCRLQPDSPIIYDALSYCWGSDDATTNDPPSKIYFVDSDEDYAEWTVPGVLSIMLKANKVSCLLVGRSLESVLEAIRSREKDVYLWVDALCINQRNLVERTAQVSRMHDVYTQADKVIIWLGTGGEDDLGKNREEEHRKTIDFLKKILDLRELDKVVDRLEKKADGTDWLEDKKDCKRTIDLMGAKWFSRRWIIQELALARTASVLYGDQEMPWRDFADAIALFMTKFDEIKAAFPEVKTYEAKDSDDRYVNSLDPKALGANILVSASSNLFRKSSTGQVIQRLLSLELLVSSMLLAFEAKDPRDTVFAVLQIAKDVYPTYSSLRPGNISNRASTAKLIGYAVPVLFAMLYYRQIVAPTDVYQRTITDSSSQYSAMGIPIVKPGLLTSTGLVMIYTLGMIILWLLSRMLITPVLNAVDGPPVNQVLDLRIAPNYRKCLVDVCGDFIEYCIEQSNSLDIICRHWVPKPKPSTEAPVSMPSWILFNSGDAFGGPSQKRKGRVHGDSFVGYQKGRFYTASGNRTPAYKFGKLKATRDLATKVESNIPGTYAEKDFKDDPLPPRFSGSLNVKGFELGVIERSEKITGPVISREAMKLCGWEKITGPVISKEALKNCGWDKKKAVARYYEVVLDQVWRILVGNRGLNGSDNPPDWYRRACRACLEWYRDDPEEAFNISKLMKMPDTPKAKVEFLRRVEQVVYHRTVVQVRSSTGEKQEYRGLAPPKAQRSDIVCILFGCSVPVILSKQDDGSFKFIGEAYIHGVMDGEAADPSMVGAEEKWFKLC
ncbi:hypothetical protein VTL71DRAFT_13163 [Oculimacula yallundae]|uniref:Heterokaryon incompatibility domain-containing protein n=1 Tax=Oculimacula yallundae TaxID=86028 RepID=A0ABR4CPI2_9HELO